MNRYSTRTSKLGEQFLVARLQGAVSYDRIAGYFCSSILEVAGEAIESVVGKVRVICNSGLSPEDVKTAALAKTAMRQEWNDFVGAAVRPQATGALPLTTPEASHRLRRLYELLKSGKLEVKVLPDEIYGLMHGKAGVITCADGGKTSFLGSMNETKSAFTTNYEMIWEDSDPDAIRWVQAEFDAFWNNRHAVPLSDYVIEDIKRVSERRPIPLKDWREAENDAAAAVAVEEPIYRNEFGLWAHQKYFVARAFEEHKRRGGARLLLADQVGLGKTVQLAMSAKLIALYDDKPVLIIVPKTLLFQWQDELKSLLNMPSAVWTGRFWVDENGYEYPADSLKAILKCPRKVGIISQGLITRKSESAELLKSMRFSCVILDEAHRARRKNLGQDPDRHKAQMNNLLAFLNEITFHAKSLLLATATPVQIDPIEAFDLLAALGMPQDADKVLGDIYSVWRRTPGLGIKYAQGEEPYPAADAEIWEIVRDPFPPGSEDRSFEILRSQLNLPEDVAVLPQTLFNRMDKKQKNRVKALWDDDFIRNHNPYLRTIVRRTRDFLENAINSDTGEPYLKKINVRLLGENDADALELSGYLAQAYAIAEEFCRMLSSRVKGGGFMSILLLKRIGSTMFAGENTARKMLAWTAEGKDRLQSLYDEVAAEDEEEPEETQPSEIKELAAEEIDCLEKLVNVLKSNTDTDPKYNRLKAILTGGVEDEGAWKDKGCILFSQYFDSALYVAERLSKDFPDLPIGLYAGGDKSGIYKGGQFRKTVKDEIKRMVKARELTILVGTDAASEGLNLQALGTLINIDLPWNPTRLEQRKGRIQRIGQLADSIYIYNMRYKDSVEDRVHSKLSGRLQGIYNLFGQIPDVLEDVWVAIAQNDEARAELAISRLPTKNPFVVKYEREIPDCGDWEKCAVVLDEHEKLGELLKGW
ncbi:MAG: phospholipase D-like domain-containing protein [Desulfovibrio sp.]|jgi:superfamily II DNA or RNA helicase|nr:phospholipase D-like domain-containing protein [Desulfovibrio sp.]